MLFPTILLGFVIAAAIGCLFHFLRGGGFKWLILDILLAIAGFWTGHFLAELAGWYFLPLGPINLGGGLIGAVLLTVGGFWLSMASVDQERNQ